MFRRKDVEDTAGGMLVAIVTILVTTILVTALFGAVIRLLSTAGEFGRFFSKYIEPLWILFEAPFDFLGLVLLAISVVIGYHIGARARK